MTHATASLGHFTLGGLGCGGIWSVVPPQLAAELVRTGDGHERVYGQQVVVDGDDVQAVLGPHQASAGDGELLGVRDVLRGPLHVRDVGDADPPLHGRCPEEDCMEQGGRGEGF